MDDRDLETRLRTRLHARFDTGEPSLELRASVEQVFRTHPRPVGLTGTLLRRRPGWGAVAALAVVTVVAVAGLSIGQLVAPGDQGPSPTPASTGSAANERWFVALPGFRATPTRADSEVVRDIFVTRLQAIGVRDIVTTTRSGVAFQVAPGGPSDDDIRAVLGAVGDVELVPLPVKDYGELGEGQFKAVVGEPLPTDPPALFGWDGIASVEQPADGDETDLSITLTPAAREVFGAWTSDHVNETIAVVVDGIVAALPTISSPIPGGQLTISAGSLATGFDLHAAILLGGRVPEDWGAPTSPALVPVEDVIAATQREEPTADALLWTLDAIEQDGLWVPVWQVTFGGDFLADCTPPPAGQPPCPVFHRLITTADATNGVPITAGYQN